MGEDKPCDQPLKYYMIATLLWSQVGFAIALCFVTHCVILLFWFPGLRSRFNAAKSYAPDIVYAIIIIICEVRAAKAIVSKSFSHMIHMGFPNHLAAGAFLGFFLCQLLAAGARAWLVAAGPLSLFELFG
jgi:hypothetical protein